MPLPSAREQQGKESPTRRAIKRTPPSAAPRLGRAAVRLRPGDWTKNTTKKPWGSPPLRTTAAPRQRCPRTPHELPAEPYDRRNLPPRSLAGEAHLAAPHRRSARRRERARPATQRNRRARVAAAPPAPPGPRGTASAPEIAPPGRAAENTKGEDHERPLQPLRDEV